MYESLHEYLARLYESRRENLPDSYHLYCRKANGGFHKFKSPGPGMEWYCCFAHYEGARDKFHNEWRSIRNLAQGYAKEDCRLARIEVPEKLYRSIPLPLYRWPVYFGPFGITCGGLANQWTLKFRKKF